MAARRKTAALFVAIMVYTDGDQIHVGPVQIYYTSATSARLKTAEVHTLLTL